MRANGNAITIRPLLFNDPVKGEVFEIPAGERCIVVTTFKEGQVRGFIRDEQELWAARTNLQRGYTLVWIRGLLRGVLESDVAPWNDLPAAKRD
ncbi:MAG: hypothetical protein KA535_00325 [Azonexus sp.]|nr:hypothetical protein [Azonexus sp.]